MNMYGPYFIKIVTIALFGLLIVAIGGWMYDLVVAAEQQGNWLLKFHLAAIILFVLIGLFLVSHPSVIATGYSVLLAQ